MNSNNVFFDGSMIFSGIPPLAFCKNNFEGIFGVVENEFTKANRNLETMKLVFNFKPKNGFMDENPVNLFPPLRGAGRLIVHFFITSLWSHNEK